MKNSPGFGSFTSVDGSLTAIVISGDNSETLEMMSTQTLPMTSGPDSNKSPSLAKSPTPTKACGSIDQNEAAHLTELSKDNVLSVDSVEDNFEGLEPSRLPVNPVRKFGQFLKIAPTNQADSRRLPHVKLVKSHNSEHSESNEEVGVVTEMPPLLSPSLKENASAKLSPEMPNQSPVDPKCDSPTPVSSPAVGANDCVVQKEESVHEEPVVVFKRTARKTFPHSVVCSSQNKLAEASMKSDSTSVSNNSNNSSSASSIVGNEVEMSCASDAPTRCASPDADLIIIDGIEFRSFGTESELEDFCAKSSSRTLNVQNFLLAQEQRQNDKDGDEEEDDDDDEDEDENDFYDLQEWGSRGYNSEGESSDYEGPSTSIGKRIIPTKTTDITKIKGWKNKVFSEYTRSMAEEGSTNPKNRRSVAVTEKLKYNQLKVGAQNSEGSGIASAVFVSDALDEFLKTKTPLRTGNLVTADSKQSMTILKPQEEKSDGKSSNYPDVGSNFQDLMNPTVITEERAMKATLALLPFLVFSRKQKGEISFVDAKCTTATTATSNPVSTAPIMTMGTVRPTFCNPHIEPPVIYYLPKCDPSEGQPKRHDSCRITADCALKAVEAIVRSEFPSKAPAKAQLKTSSKIQKPAALEPKLNPIPLLEDSPKLKPASLASETNLSSGCNQEFCQLGCVCDSLKTRKRSRKHCGRPQCMFTCRCDGFPPLPSGTRGKLLTKSSIDYDEDPPAKRRRQIRLPARLKDSAYVWTAGRELIECEIEVDDDRRHRKRQTMLRGIPGRVPLRGRPRMSLSAMNTTASSSQAPPPRLTAYRGRPCKSSSFVRLLPPKQIQREPVAATALADGRRSGSVDGRKQEAATAELAMKIILVDREVSRSRAAFLCTNAGNVCAEFTVDSCSDFILEMELDSKPKTSKTGSATASQKNLFIPLSAALHNSRIRTTSASNMSGIYANRRTKPLTVQQQLSQQRLMKAAQMVASAGACVSGKDGKYLIVTGSGEVLPCVVVPVDSKAGRKRNLPPLPPLGPVKKPQTITNPNKPKDDVNSARRGPSEMLNAALDDALQRARILQAARRNQAASGSTANVTAAPKPAPISVSQSSMPQNDTESDSDSSSSDEDSDDWGDIDSSVSCGKSNDRDITCSGLDDADATMQTTNGMKCCLERIRRKEIAENFIVLCNLLKPSVAEKSWDGMGHEYPSKVVVLAAATKSIRCLQDREQKLLGYKKFLIDRRMKLFDTYTSLLKGLEGSQQRAAVKVLIRRLQDCCRDKRKPQVAKESTVTNSSTVVPPVPQLRISSETCTSDDSTFSNSPELLQRLVATNNLEVIPIVPKVVDTEEHPLPLPLPAKAPDDGVSMASVSPVTPVLDPITTQKCQPEVADSVDVKGTEQAQADGTDSMNWPKIVAFMSISEAEFLSKKNEVSPVKTST